MRRVWSEFALQIDCDDGKLFFWEPQLRSYENGGGGASDRLPPFCPASHLWLPPEGGQSPAQPFRWGRGVCMPNLLRSVLRGGEKFSQEDSLPVPPLSFQKDLWKRCERKCEIPLKRENLLRDCEIEAFSYELSNTPTPTPRRPASDRTSDRRKIS